MKTAITTTLALWFFSVTGFAARPNQPFQDKQLLPIYLSLKDALVNSDTRTAAIKADEFVKAINTVETGPLSAEDKKTFTGLKEKLVLDAGSIAKSKDLSGQRNSFATFSANMLALAKTVKLSADPVYELYCPMKKASWLSAEKGIKNPYYGKQMLTCGEVKETI